MNKADVSELLKTWGVVRAFRPVRDDAEPETWAMETRKPARIIDGRLDGTEIVIEPKTRMFQVWTSRRKKAKAVAAEHGMRVRLLDGEAELYVPAVEADAVLPGLGARLRRGCNVPVGARRRGIAAMLAAKTREAESV